MNIYLACTVRGDRGSIAAVRHIADRLAARGHDILTKHLLADDVDVAERARSNQDVYRRDLEWLEAADVVVADASGSSYGVGFEVGYVLGRAPQTGQHVYLMYDAARIHTVSRLISGLVNPHAHVLAYHNLDDIDGFLTAHLGSAGRTRFP
jgi:nucleoside 2-deoxyribosyltransferase